MKRALPMALVMMIAGCIGGTPEGDEGYGPGHNQGADCLSCHVPGGQAGSFIWTMAGTIFTDAAGSAPQESVSVLISDDSGTLNQSLITDYNGNFWTQEPVPSPYAIALAMGPDTVAMSSHPTNPSCASCHTAGNYIHFP